MATKQQELGAEIIKKRLGRASLVQQVLFYPLVSSTNKVAWEMALTGCPEGTLVVTEEQGQGKGRFDRSWLCPKDKGILTSIVFRPALLPVEVFRLSMLASLAICRTFSRFSGLGARIKWPNDVMVNGRKLAGVLLEFPASSGKVEFAILGMGINVNFDPQAIPELQGIATSFLRETGRYFDRLEVLAQLVMEMESGYLALKAGDFGPVFDKWKARLTGLGEIVQIMSGQGLDKGIAEGVDENGALIVRERNGQTRKLFTHDIAWGLKEVGS